MFFSVLKMCTHIDGVDVFMCLLSRPSEAPGPEETLTGYVEVRVWVHILRHKGFALGRSSREGQPLSGS